MQMKNIQNNAYLLVAIVFENCSNCTGAQPLRGGGQGVNKKLILKAGVG